MDLDDDILLAAKELATASHKTAGKVVSELAGRGLRATRAVRASRFRNGFAVLPSEGGTVVTVELVEKLLE